MYRKEYAQDRRISVYTGFSYVYPRHIFCGIPPKSWIIKYDNISDLSMYIADTICKWYRLSVAEKIANALKDEIKKIASNTEFAWVLVFAGRSSFPFAYLVDFRYKEVLVAAKIPGNWDYTGLLSAAKESNIPVYEIELVGI